MARYLPTKNVVRMLILVILIGIGFVGWFVIRYPATSGYTQYEMDSPTGFDLTDAEQSLVSAGYSVEIYHVPPFYYDWELEISVSSDADGRTIIWLGEDEQNDIIEVSAVRKIYIQPYELFQDLHVLGRINHEIAVEDVREILEVVGVPSSGTFEFWDEVDSFDYFTPTTAFYFLTFAHLPIMIMLVIQIDNESRRGDDLDRGPESPINRTQH